MRLCPGIDDILARYGIKYVVLDSHGILHAEPRPRYSVFAPFTRRRGSGLRPGLGILKAGVECLGGLSRDYFYRDFYRDIGFDLDYDYIKPYLVDVRGFTASSITGSPVKASTKKYTIPKLPCSGPRFTQETSCSTESFRSSIWQTRWIDSR